METGTYKALDACLTSANLRRAKAPMAVVSSAANLGRALSAYSARLGLGLVFFHPATTGYKLDSGPGLPGVTRVCVDLPETRIKQLARAFADHWGLPLVPDPSLRQAASAARAAFLVECSGEHGPFDHLGYRQVGRCWQFERSTDL